MIELIRPLLILYLFAIVGGCVPSSPVPPSADLTGIPYAPTTYPLKIPKGLPPSPWLSDHALTEEGVRLGRYLFYDAILSRDRSRSCSTCHHMESAFAGESGTRRRAQSLVNVSYPRGGYGWDGRSNTLESHIEYMLTSEQYMNGNNDKQILERLWNSNFYPPLFRRAFGTQYATQIRRDEVVNALGQFLNIILSGNSKYDRVSRREAFYMPEEQDGADMFFDANPLLPDAECAHCHIPPLFYTPMFVNNGLDSVQQPYEFPDAGRGEITRIRSDSGKFRVPGIRNIASRERYMHDGRIQSLEEVIEFYNTGGHQNDNSSPYLHPLGLSDYQKYALLCFLRTLTDTSLMENPELANPF